MPSSEDLLPIGDLAQRCGVATSALRYYEELGLLQPTTRVSGQRRYDESAVSVVGVILFLADVGFTLTEIGELVASRAASPTAWRELAQRKAGELRVQLADTEAALVAVEHSLECPRDDILTCPNFWQVVGERLEGRGLQETNLH